MADFDLDAMLTIDDSEVDDVNDELEAGVGGGDMSPAQQDQQEGVVAGGVSKGLAGAAVLAGILSQLKSVTAIISSVFGIASRALLPAIEVIADILRPINEAINSFLKAPQEALQEASRATGAGQTAREEGKIGLFTGIGGTISDEQLDTMQQRGFNIDLSFLNDTSKPNPDQTDEAKKQQWQQILEDAARDITGAFR